MCTTCCMCVRACMLWSPSGFIWHKMVYTTWVRCCDYTNTHLNWEGFSKYQAWMIWFIIVALMLLMCAAISKTHFSQQVVLKIWYSNFPDRTEYIVKNVMGCSLCLLWLPEYEIKWFASGLSILMMCYCYLHNDVHHLWWENFAICVCVCFVLLAETWVVCWPVVCCETSILQGVWWVCFAYFCSHKA